MSAAEDAFCIHDLIVGTCTICLHGLARGPQPTLVEATFPAKHPGHCNGCNLPIWVGQNIHKLTTGRYIHVGCE